MSASVYRRMISWNRWLVNLKPEGSKARKLIQQCEKMSAKVLHLQLRKNAFCIYCWDLKVLL